MSQYFPKPHEPFDGDINVKVDLSNYATKADIKNISHVDTSSFAWRTNLASLKTEVDKLVIDKLAPVPVDLSKLNGVVKNDVVKKKNAGDILVAKLNSIDTGAFVLKTKYGTDKSELENEIWHETCKSKCRLDANVCNNKQYWNDDKCRCECEELIDKGLCDRGYIWNPSNGESECDKSCGFGEYLDYESCKCRKGWYIDSWRNVMKLLKKWS